MNRNVEETRRRFMAHFASIGLGTTLVPGVLWARMQDTGAQQITLAMVTDSLKLAGLEFSDTDREAMVANANRSLTSYSDLRKMTIPNDVSPPSHFSALVPGMKVSKEKLPFRLSPAPVVKRPANLEDVAFWPIRNLGELLRTKQVTSVELTQMYLGRLHRYNEKLNNVVTFLDDVGMAQAKQADAEIAAGKYKGPLHGIPWGAKDIIAVKGYKTTWGSGAYKDQVLDYDATLVELLREAGAVLIAKVTTGELAGGDNWFGGQTKNPWDPTQGSGGSSAGPASATAAGCIAFGIGSETQGSILGPSSRCGLTGLRPTLGRVSRFGVMALGWSYDRMGPICRHVEDCAIVMQAIAKPDDKDLAVVDFPFNWNAQLDIKKLRVGYIKESFEDIPNPTVKANAQKSLEVFKSLGVTEMISLHIPDSFPDVGGFNVEASAFFTDLIKEGREKYLTSQTRGASFKAAHLIPAVEYIQGQRARMMMMMKLAEVTKDVDVYLVGSPGPQASGARGAAPGGGGAPVQPATPQTAAQRHSTMANSACYPALNMPNGFNDAPVPTPTNFTLFARPFHEMELLALGKAYQDAAGFASKHPQLT
jgi:Asp-tRNA(Asn)/Glu-tRNA(Gln) amidotransferase A subunit family amidase